jgi:hypothetical protein
LTMLGIEKILFGTVSPHLPNRKVRQMRKAQYEMAAPLDQYLREDYEYSPQFRETNNLLNKTGFLQLGEAVIPACIQLRNTEKWLAHTIKGGKFSPPWFNGSNEPLGTCWITILIQNQMRKLWKGKKRPNQEEELDLLHRATGELVSTYHTILSQSLREYDQAMRKEPGTTEEMILREATEAFDCGL